MLTRAWFCQTGSRLRMVFSLKFSNWSKTCNIPATRLKFCDEQQGETPLLFTRFQQFEVYSCNVAGFRSIWIVFKNFGLIKPWSCLIKSTPDRIVLVVCCCAYIISEGLFLNNIQAEPLYTNSNSVRFQNALVPTILPIQVYIREIMLLAYGFVPSAGDNISSI